MRARLPRPRSISGLTVDLLDISKPRGDLFLDRIEQHLRVVRQPPRLIVAVAPLEHAQIQVLFHDLVERVLERAAHDLIRIAQRNPLVLKSGRFLITENSPGWFVIAGDAVTPGMSPGVTVFVKRERCGFEPPSTFRDRSRPGREWPSRNYNYAPAKNRARSAASVPPGTGNCP